MAVPSTGLAVADVEALLRDPSYVTLERHIAEAVDQPLLPDYLDFVLPLVTNDLNETQLTLAHARQLLSNRLPEAAAFGVALIRGEDAVPDEQEWDPSEGNQQEQRHKGERVGLSPGFGLLALVYLHFLNSGRETELLALLKRRRVPHAKRFLARLKSYHQTACAV
jgi:hypothetical protein